MKENRMFAMKALLASFVLLLAAAGLAQGLDGRFRIQQDGLDFAVSLSGTATQQPAGTVHSVEGDIALRQLAVMADGSIMGVFNIQQYFAGFVGVLRPDGNTMDIYLYQLDAQGAPQPGSEEHYVGTRESGFIPPPEPEPEVGPNFGDMIRRAQEEDQQQEGRRTPVVPPPATDSLAGAWEGGFSIDGAEFFDRVSLNADGTFTQEAYYNGAFVALFGGRWQYANGVLIMDATEHPDQLCLGTECGPYEYEGPDAFRVEILGENAIRLHPESVPGLVIEYSRVQ